jgi:hypothetical protein
MPKDAASNFPDAHLTTLNTVWQLIGARSDHSVTNTLQLAIVLGIRRREIVRRKAPTQNVIETASPGVASC